MESGELIKESQREDGPADIYRGQNRTCSGHKLEEYQRITRSSREIFTN